MSYGQYVPAGFYVIEDADGERLIRKQMSADQSDRSLYQRLQEMEADIAFLAEHPNLRLGFGTCIKRLRENIDVLLGEGDVWGSYSKLIEDTLVTDPLSKRESS